MNLEASDIAYGLIIFLVIYWVFYFIYLGTCSVKIYRFYRPGCGWCQRSQAGWNGFQRGCFMSKYRTKEINMDRLSPQEEALARNFEVKTVPHVVAVLPDGRRYAHKDSDRSKEAYRAWVKKLE